MAVHKKLKKLKPKVSKDNLLKPTVFVLIFAAMGGAYLLYRILANTTNFAINNQLNNSTLAVDDPTASGGKALLFKSAPTPPPTPPPGPPPSPPPSGGYTCTDTNVTPSNIASKISAAGPGTVLCLNAGTYGTISIIGKNGQSGKPIVIQSLPGTRPVVRPSSGAAIFMNLSSFIVIRGLEQGPTNSHSTIIYGSHDIIYENNYIHDQLQPPSGAHDWAGIKVSKYQYYDNGTYIKPSDPTPYNITIRGNRIVGKTGSYGRKFNEGIYVGSSTGSTSNPDRTSNIIIENNEISNTGSEAIDIKPGAMNVTIRNNLIHDIYLTDSAAITVARNGNTAYSTSGNFLIEGNKIWNVNASSLGNGDAEGIDVGIGNAIIRNNIVWSTKRSPINISSTYNYSPSFRTVTITGNTLFSPGTTSIVPTGWPNNGNANVIVDSTNKTHDGAMGTTRISSCPVCTPQSLSGF